MTMAALFDLITVHCFTCRHVEQGPTPQAAHDQMEAHYAAEHGELIRSIVEADLRVPVALLQRRRVRRWT
jgi:hypothetical protein